MKHFDDHRSAQAWYSVDSEGRPYSLVSYTTTVIEITSDGWLYVNGLYSKTTRKHIGWFMRLLGMTYQDAKALYEDGMTYNVNTGEVKPMR